MRLQIPTRDAFHNLRICGFVANIKDSPKSLNTQTRKQITAVCRLRFPTLGTHEESHFWCRVFCFASNFTPKYTQKKWVHHIMVGDAIEGPQKSGLFTSLVR